MMYTVKTVCKTSNQIELTSKYGRLVVFKAMPYRNELDRFGFGDWVSIVNGSLVLLRKWSKNHTLKTQ